jgi:hypothetical protein
MKTWERYKFNTKEQKIWELYLAYTRANRERNYIRNLLPKTTDPRKSKYWTYFEQVIENFKNETTFDPYFFMEAQYRNLSKDKILWPAQLKTKEAIKKYKEHRQSQMIIDYTSETEKIIYNLATTCKLIINWWKRNKKSKNDYYSFFLEKKSDSIISEGVNYCLQGMISKYFMAVSKHFEKAYKELDPDIKWEIIEPDDLKAYRINLKTNKEAYDFAVDIFGSEEIL